MAADLATVELDERAVRGDAGHLALDDPAYLDVSDVLPSRKLMSAP